MEPILACVDFSAVTDVILRHAAELAGGMERELVVLHVVPAEPEWVGWGPGPQSVRDQVAAQLWEARERTRRSAIRLREAGLPRVRGLTLRGPTPETILRRAEVLGASIIVLGAHHRGRIHELVVGSVARTVLRHTTRPVLVVPGRRAA